MKKEAKSTKSQLRNDIKLSIITELKSVAGKFGAGSKKADRAILKGAKLLAKKLAKGVKVETTQAPAVEVVATDAPVAAKPVKAKAAKAPKA